MATTTSLNLTDTTKTNFFTAAEDGTLTINLYNAGGKLVVVNIFVGSDQVAARTLTPGEDGAFFGLALKESDVVYLQAAGDGTIDVIARAAIFYPGDFLGGDSTITVDNSIIENSPNPVEGGALYTALSAKQNTLTAGTGIDIIGDVISATGGGGGGGTQILFAIESVNFSAAVPSRTTVVKTVTIGGAEVGDAVVYNAPPMLTAVHAVMTTAYVSAADTVSIGVYNRSGSAVTPASGDWIFAVIKNPTPPVTPA